MRSARPQIIIVNRSNGLVTDSNALRIVHAIQRQVDEFSKAWGVGATISYLRANGRSAPMPLAWQVVLLQNADQPDALGYHDLTPQGKPLAKVFCEDAADAGEEVSVVVSHEILEMLADPNLSGFEHHGQTGLLYAREVCDPCEGSENGYVISGVRVSDYVLPAYFQDGAPGPFDQCRRIKAPFEILPGGYLPALDPKANAWVDIGLELKPGTRLERRLRRYHEQPQHSDAATRAPLAAAAKPAPKVPKVNPLRANHPQRALAPKPAPRPAPIRQPDRGRPHHDKSGPAAPLRQPLRGHRAEAAEHAAEARAHAPATGPVPSGLDQFLEPVRDASPAQKPAPKRQPLRGARAPQAALEPEAGDTGSDTATAVAPAPSDAPAPSAIDSAPSAGVGDAPSSAPSQETK